MTSRRKPNFHLFGTQAGLAAARARGRMGGRPKKLGTSTKVAMAWALYKDETHSIKDIWTSLCISRTTLYRYLTLGDGGGDGGDTIYSKR